MGKRFKNVSKRRKFDDELDFNGNWGVGEASHHIGKRMTEKVIKSKKPYSRKSKYKHLDFSDY